MKVFLIAGEASGDRLGAALMAGLKSLDNMEFQGVGGPLMQAEGMQSLFPMDELSVMGLAEILPKYMHLRRRLHQTAEAVLAAQPDVLITIDSPDFCLRVARLVRAKSAVRTVHYVAPSVWAWRAGRARKMAGVIDHVLALLPFEPPYMEAAGMECDFVGHPVVSEPQATPEEIERFRARHGIDGPLWMVLPGSRRGEVSWLGDRFSDVVRRVLAARPDLSLVLPTTETVAPLVREMVADWPVRPLILSPEGMDAESYKAEKRAAFGAADWALAASGTVSLELAAARTPMVIAYDLKPLSRFIISRMLRVDTLTLVNLVSETRVIPEFIGKACRPELIAPAMLGVMDNPSPQLAAMDLTMDRLGRGGEAPGLRAARAVLARMKAATG
ncbi:lipid-A-disaccharide synthase [Roseovarius pacificus]|uniref:Lipid-A-disaccharide synthase n=1 Tax=Roseovarius pacificus TaxID=337701 RepID=A0A1M6WZ67_9RHOB|nr:lipid-A-disaccharide synthase [Roseovarius pacificus]GGO52758.1 lipid-A-disaccharide synthase [Roseovarius pacificus]SHK98976.1 lipid-A-disaccharide synthase [Roseovarius pacificus]